MRKESKEFGKNLKRVRTLKGISQGKIARILAVNKAFISNIENGKTNPTLTTITKLAKAIGISVDEFFK